MCVVRGVVSFVYWLFFTFVAGWLLFVCCCALYAIYCVLFVGACGFVLLFVVGRLMFFFVCVDCCSLVVVRCALSVVCCLSCVVRFVSCVVCLLCVV